MNTNGVKKTKSSNAGVVMQKAMKLMASAWHDPYESTDRQTGEVSTKNSLGFWQDGVMSGVLFQLSSKLDYTRTTTIPRAKESVEIAFRAHKGDELSEVRLNQAVDWLQRLEEQAAQADEALQICIEEYAAATGKSFRYVSRQGANRDVVESPAMARAKALGVGAQNVAAGYGSNADGMTVTDKYGRELGVAEPKGRLPDAHGRVRDAEVKRAATARAKAVKAAKQQRHDEAVARIAAADKAKLEQVLSAGRVHALENSSKRDDRTTQGGGRKKAARSMAEIGELIEAND